VIESKYLIDYNIKDYYIYNWNSFIAGHNFNILTIFENKEKIPETRNLIEPNIDMINLWIVACNFYIFLW
jgi:hypothetical protein